MLKLKLKILILKIALWFKNLWDSYKEFRLKLYVKQLDAVLQLEHKVNKLNKK